MVTSVSVVSGRAQESDTQQTSDIQSNYVAMRQAYCAQNWSEALQFSDLLLNSHELQPDYREMIVSFRERLQTYQDTNAEFDSISGCEPTVNADEPSPSPTPQVSDDPSPSPTPQVSNESSPTPTPENTQENQSQG